MTYFVTYNTKLEKMLMILADSRLYFKNRSVDIVLQVKRCEPVYIFRFLYNSRAYGLKIEPWCRITSLMSS